MIHNGLQKLKHYFDDLGWYILFILEELFSPLCSAGRVPTTELVNRIFTFCELYSGKTLYPYQERFSKRVIRSVLDNDGEEITALFSRQSGKSETIAVTVGGLMIILPELANMPMFADDPRLTMFKEGVKVGVFAPSQRQAQITYNRIKTRLQCDTAIEVLSDPEFRLEFTTSNGQTCALSNGSFVTSISASDGSNIEGESFMVIICEECQDISNFKIRKSIHPMGAAYNATIVKIGTATTFKGDFYDAIQRNKRDDEQKKGHIKNHFEFDCRVAAKYNPKYAKYVESEKKRLGENSDEFRMAYMLEWIIERGMFVDIEKFEKNNTEFLLERVMEDHSANHVMGIDLGGKGDDTILTPVEVDWGMPVIQETRQDEETGEEIVYTAYNTYLKDWMCISNCPDYEEQYPLIMDYISHFRVARVVCDATREASVAHRLRANLNCEVIPYIFTTKSKSEMYKHLLKEIDSGRARVCGGEQTQATREYIDFMEQLGELEKGWSGTHMVVSHPDEKGAHDDYCLSMDTQVLTKRGFLSYDELNEEDLVASVIDNTIVYVKPSGIIHKKYSGVMYNFHSKDLDLKVTRNHKMKLRHRKTGKEFSMLSQDLASMPLIRMYNTLAVPVAPIQESADYAISDDMIKQGCWFITEGWINNDRKNNTRRYSFGQSIYKPMYQDICGFVNRMGLTPYTYTRKDGVTYWTFHTKDNPLFDSVLKEGIHRIPREWLSNFSQRQLRLVLDTLMYGDGTISRKTYSTNSLELAQDFQELAHKLGIKTSIKPDKKGMYNCYLMGSDETRVQSVKKSLYDGFVWCVNVSNGFIVTRRNNKIAVVGNCDSWALAVWGASFEGEVNTAETGNTNKFTAKTRAESVFYKARNKMTARRRR